MSTSPRDKRGPTKGRKLGSTGYRSRLQGLDELEVVEVRKLIRYLRALGGGFERACVYLEGLCQLGQHRAILEPVLLFLDPPRVAARARPQIPPGPENFAPHELKVTFKRRRHS